MAHKPARARQEAHASNLVAWIMPEFHPEVHCRALANGWGQMVSAPRMCWTSLPPLRGNAHRRNRLNVLFASHLFPNPVQPVSGVFVKDLANALARHCHLEVVAPISSFPLLQARRKIPEVAHEECYRVWQPSRFGLPPLLGRWRWVSYRQALRRADLRRHWDVVHSHWINPDAYAVSRWEGAARAIQVATVHGHAALGMGIGAVPTPLIRQALQALDHVIAVSSELRDVLVRQFSVPATKVSVQFNGIDATQFQPRPNSAARRDLGLAQNLRIILVVARLSPEKGLDLLLRAMANQRLPSTRLHIIGDGPLRTELLDLRERLGLQSMVHFEGPVRHEKLPVWFATADLLCLPSWHEGCPVVVHEALASGLPVVSTRVGAVPDLVDTASGILCPPGDGAALAQALEVALSMAWDREAIARRGAVHTWDRVASQLIEVYQGLIARSRERRVGSQGATSG